MKPFLRILLPAAVCGLLLGDNVDGIAKELGGYGADKVMVCDSPLLKDYTTDAYAKVVCDMVNEYKPEVLLIGATNIGRDLGPRCAARLHTGLTADATHLDIDTAKYIDFLKESSTIDLSKQKFDMEDRNLKMTRPAFGGHLMATIICPRFRPQMSTVRPGVMKKAPFDQAKADACQIVKPAFSLTAEEFVEHGVDFLVVGTNDLTQYTHAADRELASAEHYYRPASNAMKKLITMVMDAAKVRNVPVTICGLAVGNPANTVQYLQLGLRSFSVSPQNLLSTKKALLEADAHPDDTELE
mgnify:CR=1 FL=1